MLDQESQLNILAGLSEGDVIEAGSPFKFAPDERLTWKCVGIEPAASDCMQYTFHIFFMGVIVKAACAVVGHGKVNWRAA